VVIGQVEGVGDLRDGGAGGVEGAHRAQERRAGDVEVVAGGDGSGGPAGMCGEPVIGAHRLSVGVGGRGRTLTTSLPGDQRGGRCGVGQHPVVVVAGDQLGHRALFRGDVANHRQDADYLAGE